MARRAAMDIRGLSLFAVVSFLLAVASSLSAQTPKEGGAPQTQDAKPSSAPHPKAVPPDAARVLLERRRTAVRELEAEWKQLREEVEAHLADVTMTSSLEAEKAEAEYQKARLEREIVEIKLTEYVDGIAVQERERLVGEAALAKDELERRNVDVGRAQKAHEQGLIPEHELITIRLRHDRALFANEQAETQLAIFDPFTKDRQIKTIKEEIQHLQTLEDAAGRKWEQAKSAVQEWRDRSARLKSKVSETHVAALLEEASSLHAKVLKLLEGVPATNKLEAPTVGQGKQELEASQKMVAEALKLEKESRGKIVKALDLAKVVQVWRDDLRDVEAKLRKARNELKLSENTP